MSLLGARRTSHFAQLNHFNNLLFWTHLPNLKCCLYANRASDRNSSVIIISMISCACILPSICMVCGLKAQTLFVSVDVLLSMDDSVATCQDKKKIEQELRETFTAELANTAYIPFSQLAGGLVPKQKLLVCHLNKQLLGWKVISGGFYWEGSATMRL